MYKMRDISKFGICRPSIRTAAGKLRFFCVLSNGCRTVSALPDICQKKIAGERMLDAHLLLI